MKKILLIAMITIIAGCTDARIASKNLSKAAEYFELNRRIVFYNGITGEYMLVMEGRCSVESLNSRLSVTCKTGHGMFKKHYLGLSDNVTYFSEQLDAAEVDDYHYRVVFKPRSIVPNFELK